MKLKYTLLYIYSFVALFLVACTEVDLCHGEHPHRSDINVFFDFGTFQSSPDTMIVFAVRNLNLLRYTYRLDATGRTERPAEGILVFPNELRERAYVWADSLDKEGNVVLSDTFPDSSPIQVKDFTGNDSVRLHPGDYEMVAFSGGRDIYYDNLEAVMQSDAENVDSLWVAYVTYRSTQDHPLLRRYADWSTYNTYSDFILGGDAFPTFMAQKDITVPVTEKHSTIDCTFDATNLSQQVNISFQIKKDVGIAIDSILVELSGIPWRYYLMAGSLDIDQTYKTLFKPSLPSDNKDTELVTAKGSIWVNGIVRSANPEFITGPGIMWVCAYVHAEDADGFTRRKSIIACINLYNLLSEHRSLKLTETGEIVQVTKVLDLTIPAPAILAIDKGTLTSEEGVGIDQWKPGVNIGIDI